MPKKTKIGIEFGHVTRDSDTMHFQGQTVKGQLAGGAYCGGLPHRLLLLLSPKADNHLP